MPYHISPVTGQPNLCKAKQRCPYGGPDLHFASKDEARQFFEKEMAGETHSSVSKSQAPGFPAPSPYRLYPQFATYVVDYEYDSYDCSDYSYCSQSDDYCRDKVYEGLRVETVTDEQVYSYAANWIGTGTVPPDLKQRLDARMDEWAEPSNWEVYGEGGYYGEEVHVDAPAGLDDEIQAWYYDQEGAMDRDEVLPYLRGMGFDTRGKTPVEAVKAYLASQNGGKLSPEAQAATRVEVHSLSLKRIEPPNKARYARTAAVAPKPEPKAGTKKEFAGVLVETNATPVSPWQRSWGHIPPIADVKLLDGYGRVKHLKTATSRTKATFLVLRK